MYFISFMQHLEHTISILYHRKAFFFHLNVEHTWAKRADNLSVARSLCLGLGPLGALKSLKSLKSLEKLYPETYGSLKYSYLCPAKASILYVEVYRMLAYGQLYATASVDAKEWCGGVEILFQVRITIRDGWRETIEG